MDDEARYFRIVGEPSDRTFSALGMIVLASAEMESHLVATLNYLSKSERMYLLTDGYGFAAACRDIRLLVKNIEGSCSNEPILDLLGSCEQAYRKRNVLVHGRWVPIDLPRLLATPSLEASEHLVVKRRRGESAVSRFTTEQIEELAVEMRGLVARVRQLNDWWLEAFDPMQEGEVRTL